jgi:hypothetical protein
VPDFGPHLALTSIVRLPRKIESERKYEHKNGNDWFSATLKLGWPARSSG